MNKESAGKKDSEILKDWKAEHFDEWAPYYDESVFESDRDNTFPFAGYSKILQKVIWISDTHGGNEILELGSGTGILTEKLSGLGFKVTGTDFSEEMLNILRRKMPGGNFLMADLKEEFPQELLDKKFDIIISTYVFHHFTDNEKIKLIMRLNTLLKPGGIIITGDIMTKTQEEMDEVKISAGDLFDESEFYTVSDKLSRNIPFPGTEFYQVSHCAGIMVIHGRDLSFPETVLKNIKLRESVKTDGQILMKWWNNGEVMEHAGFTEGLGISPDEAEKAADNTFKKIKLIIIEIDGKPVGEMNFKPRADNSVHIGIKICEKKYQGRGYGKTVLSLFFKELFNKGYERISLDTWDTNLRARRVYERLGFKRTEGSPDYFTDDKGTRRNIFYYSLLPKDFNDFSDINPEP